MRQVYFLPLFLVFGAAVCFAEPLDVKVNAQGAILMNAETGAILYEKNAKKKLHPASTTKITTALYALKKKRDALDQLATATQDTIGSVSPAAKKRSKYTLPAYWLEWGASHVSIQKGEKLSLRSLLYAMMLPSADDASNIIAEFVSGSVPKFVDEMTAYVRALGAEDTTFKNPHGLHHPEHVTTAYDLALITKEALKDPFFRKVVSTVRYRCPKTNLRPAMTWVQTNRLMKNNPYYYEHAIGVKTGYVSAAGHTLVAAAEKNGRTLIAVLLKCKKRTDTFSNATALFEAAFKEEMQEKMLVKQGKQPHSFEVADLGVSIPTYVEKGVKVRYFPSEEPKVKGWLEWDEVSLPVVKGQRLGHLRIAREDGGELTKVPLLAARSTSDSWIYSLFGFHLNPIFSFSLIAIAFLGIGWKVLSRSR